MIVLGIDPGGTGALAWVDGNRQLLKLEDMPCITLTSNNSSRQEISPPHLLALLHTFHRPDMAIIEEPMARPLFSRNKQTGAKEKRQPGAKGMKSLGDNFGVLRMGCTAVTIPYRRVPPGTWKKAMGLTADKNESRRLAQEMFPGWAEYFARVKDNGRAEAALLAVWGLTN